VRVAFDEQIFAVQRYGGISRMFYELARQFIADPDLGVDLLPLSAPVINRYVLDDAAVRDRLAVRQARHEFTALARTLMRVQPRRGLAVVHNSFYLPHGLAIYPGARRVVTIHDLIPEMLPRTRRRLDLLTVKERYIRSADHIICVSHATRLDLQDVYGSLRAKVSVVHHGVDERFSPGHPRPQALPEHYVLFVGNRGQYKDAAVLIDAFAALCSRYPDVQLAFVGGGGLTAVELEDLDRRGIGRRVVCVSLPDSQMAGAYGNALAFVFPSRHEGFGMPVLEAMASGTATLLARATSLPEVGADAAAYFTAGDAGDLACALDGLLGDEPRRRQLVEAGRARAATFTWTQAARRTRDAYREAVRPG